MITSSGLGYVPVGSLFPVYCSTKAAVHYYCVGIRQALKGTNVNVLELVPPYVSGTELGAGHVELVKSLKPLPMEDFIKEVFGVFESNQTKDLKEIGGGTAIPRIQAWRSGIGEMLLSSGLGG
jgi:uncharacterized oxidoreductase